LFIGFAIDVFDDLAQDNEIAIAVIELPARCVDEVAGTELCNERIHPPYVQAGLQQVVATMQLRADDSRSLIRLTPSPEPCFVFGDPGHLENVFYNLIDNALKYAGPGMDLQIDCRAAAGQVRVSFKDNGPGIDAVYREKIFERFFRIPYGGDTHTHKGTGLGLHYTREVIQQHEGTITMNSEPGKGSIFLIILPGAS
jgi:signal transduction histidine kinase